MDERGGITVISRGLVLLRLANDERVLWTLKKIRSLLLEGLEANGLKAKEAKTGYEDWQRNIGGTAGTRGN